MTTTSETTTAPRVYGRDCLLLPFQVRYSRGTIGVKTEAVGADVVRRRARLGDTSAVVEPNPDCTCTR